ncbi:MAG TPA: glyoxalase/bleomycin resistance/extradiol dioxygenase family protein [Gammaproteobacteria bacterium]|nr:glyoxalase/bleomycin resistance/extradiol dioxygenase family protein [Gammaproteobacteria bacterium]
MELSTSVIFSGQCEAAFKFYERCLGAKIAFMLTWGDSPMATQVRPEWHKKLLHARLMIGDMALVGGDFPPEQYEQPKGFRLLLAIDDPVDAERVFAALAENGTVKMPMQKTFWAARYGVVVDQFGIPWDINCERPQ